MGIDFTSVPLLFFFWLGLLVFPSVAFCAGWWVIAKLFLTTWKIHHSWLYALGTVLVSGLAATPLLFTEMEAAESRYWLIHLVASVAFIVAFTVFEVRSAPR